MFMQRRYRNATVAKKPNLKSKIFCCIFLNIFFRTKGVLQVSSFLALSKFRLKKKYKKSNKKKCKQRRVSTNIASALDILKAY